MAYQEIHFNSKFLGRTSGSRSHPRFILQNPIYPTHYFLRYAQVPLSWVNVRENETLGMFTSDTDGNLLESFVHTWPKGDYTIASFTAQLQILVGSFTPAGVVTTTTILGKLHFVITGINTGAVNQFAFSRVQTARDVSRFMGLDLSDNVNQHCFELEPCIMEFPIQLDPSKLIYLRSSMAHGTQLYSHTSAAQGGGNSSNILAKIPVDLTSFDSNGYLHFENPIPASPQMMFKFNGPEVSELDFFFTGENSDRVLDFEGLDFNITLGFIQ